jgi:hypothetical protein
MFLETKVVIMYAKSEDLEYARKDFDEMSEQNVVSWTMMIATLLAEEKRTTEGDSQPEFAFYARNNCNRSTKDKEEIECHYCKKVGHMAWKCR